MEGADGPVTLSPVTLLDFMGPAIRVMRERDRQRAERRAAQDAARRQREQEELRQREEEEQKRLAELEQQRREAEEKLKRQEQQRLQQEAAEKAWREALESVAVELVQILKVKVGNANWGQITESERTQAVRDIEEQASVPLSEKSTLERQVNQRRKSKLAGEALHSAVLARVRDAGAHVVEGWATKFKAIGAKRVAEAEALAAEQALRSKAISAAELLELAHCVKPNGALLDVLYAGLLQGRVTLVHADTYRSEFEQKEKKGQRFAPFSREYSVRVYGTDSGRPNRFEWCSWVVHVHFRTSENPGQREYLHLKSGAEKRLKINHVINNSLDRYLGPVVSSAIDPAKDAKLPDIK